LDNYFVKPITYYTTSYEVQPYRLTYSLRMW